MRPPHLFRLSCSELSSAFSLGAYSRTTSARLAFLLHCRQTVEEKKKTRSRQRPAEGIEIHPGIERAAADLRTLGGGSLSFEPAQDAGEAEEVAAAQRRQPVLAGRRPRLEADGAGVALALLALGRRGGPRHLGERLHAKKQNKKKKHRKSLQSCRKDWGDSPGLQSPRRDIVG